MMGTMDASLPRGVGSAMTTIEAVPEKVDLDKKKFKGDTKGGSSGTGTMTDKEGGVFTRVADGDEAYLTIPNDMTLG
jgi:hypothetical protein